MVDKYPKETIEIHKRFDIPHAETVITHYACAHKGKFLKQGRMYVTQSYLCFHAQLFGKHHKKQVAFADITDISKQNYGMIPSAIKIVVKKKKEMLFAAFLQRDSAYTDFVKQWNIVKGPEKDDGDGEDEYPESVHVQTGADHLDDVELKTFSFSTTEKARKNASYNNDITKNRENTSSPKNLQNHHPADDHPSVSQRAQALMENGAIISSDNEEQEQTSTTTQQQEMLADSAATPPRKLCWCF